MAEAHKLEGERITYTSQNSGQLQLNDEIPMEFGGFGPPIDPNIFSCAFSENFHDGKSLLNDLV